MHKYSKILVDPDKLTNIVRIKPTPDNMCMIDEILNLQEHKDIIGPIVVAGTCEDVINLSVISSDDVGVLVTDEEMSVMEYVFQYIIVDLIMSSSSVRKITSRY